MKNCNIFLVPVVSALFIFIFVISTRLSYEEGRTDGYNQRQNEILKALEHPLSVCEKSNYSEEELAVGYVPVAGVCIADRIYNKELDMMKACFIQYDCGSMRNFMTWND